MRRNSRGGREGAHDLQAGRRGVGALGRDVRTAGARGEGASGPTQFSVLRSVARCVVRGDAFRELASAAAALRRYAAVRSAEVAGAQRPAGCVSKKRRSAAACAAGAPERVGPCAHAPSLRSPAAQRASPGGLPPRTHRAKRAGAPKKRAARCGSLLLLRTLPYMCSLTGGLRPPPAPPAPPLRQPRAQRATPPRPPGRCSRRWCTAAAQGQTG